MEAAQETAPAAPKAPAKAAPVRGRAPRVDLTRARRRRRDDGTLNRMHQFKLDCIPPEALDLQNYVYRWINDEGGKLRAATRADDYDFVQSHELGEAFNTEATDSESSERLRMVVGTDKGGEPIYSYLCRKPRVYHEEDYEAVVDSRADMMEHRVHGAVSSDGERRPVAADDQLVDDEGALDMPEGAYVPAGERSVGSGGGRRRGPISRTKK